jgi:hypothetical protein
VTFHISLAQQFYDMSVPDLGHLWEVRSFGLALIQMFRSSSFGRTKHIKSRRICVR